MISFPRLGKYGRMGNCLWQIASTVGIAYHFHMQYIFPMWPYMNDFKNVYCDDLDGASFMTYYQEPTPYFQWPNINPSKSCELHGYFQSYKYFQDCENEIRRLFDFSEAKFGFPLNQVSIHVRRGDYLNLSHIHINLGMDYYNKAMAMFSKDTEYYIFSDDVAWCRQNFIGDQFHFYDNIYRKDTEVIEFQLMSQCKDNIIANSSFSFWSAYLNSNKDKRIIYPSRWVNGETRNDRIPENDSRWEIIQI